MSISIYCNAEEWTQDLLCMLGECSDIRPHSLDNCTICSKQLTSIIRKAHFHIIHLKAGQRGNWKHNSGKQTARFKSTHLFNLQLLDVLLKWYGQQWWRTPLVPALWVQGQPVWSSDSGTARVTHPHTYTHPKKEKHLSPVVYPVISANTKVLLRTLYYHIILFHS